MISEARYQEYLNQGYSQEEIDQAIRERELETSYNDTQQAPTARRSINIIPSALPNNSMEWQVELNSTLERIEHLLRGDVAQIQSDGSIIYEKPKSEEDYIVNEDGVRELLRIVTMYININTLFSDYDDTQIDDKVYDFGCKLNDTFYLQYDEFGMDTEKKRKKVPMLINGIKDMVHSTYLRARHGKERDTLRKIYSINENLNSGMGYGNDMGNMNGQRQERSFFNPARYFLGKFKN